ncbi:hypothetical protein CC86DRAFT_458858 [Ophiobolus disseminans]|uniref:Uncharacterized protein n=1 Tax=Ophiobolus disseminans TaxID=1469910 RepID=A0A6A6ZLI0_9PLEO|nr:hypothetical protein CC86DRAFT_458858 [Ophiobolus disseminans]
MYLSRLSKILFQMNIAEFPILLATGGMTRQLGGAAGHGMEDEGLHARAPVPAASNLSTLHAPPPPPTDTQHRHALFLSPFTFCIYQAIILTYASFIPSLVVRAGIVQADTTVPSGASAMTMRLIKVAGGANANITVEMLAEMLLSEGTIENVESVAGNTNIVVSMFSGETIDMTIHFNEAANEAAGATVGGKHGASTTRDDSTLGDQLLVPHGSRSLNESRDELFDELRYQSPDVNTTQAQLDGEGVTSETESTGLSQDDATVDSHQQTMADFLADLSRNDEELMRDRGHTAVYGRSHPASWENTEELVEGSGAWVGAGDQSLTIGDHDISEGM